jgi:hypothetical protein
MWVERLWESPRFSEPMAELSIWMSCSYRRKRPRKRATGMA